MYDLNGGKILGTGISGMVRVVKHLTTGELYAMKTLHLNRLKTKASLDDLRNEVRRSRRTTTQQQQQQPPPPADEAGVAAGLA